MLCSYLKLSPPGYSIVLLQIHVECESLEQEDRSSSFSSPIFDDDAKVKVFSLPRSTLAPSSFPEGSRCSSDNRARSSLGQVSISEQFLLRRFFFPPQMIFSPPPPSLSLSISQTRFLSPHEALQIHTHSGPSEKSAELSARMCRLV